MAIQLRRQATSLRQQHDGNCNNTLTQQYPRSLLHSVNPISILYLFWEWPRIDIAPRLPIFNRLYPAGLLTWCSSFIINISCSKSIHFWYYVFCSQNKIMRMSFTIWFYFIDVERFHVAFCVGEDVGSSVNDLHLEYCVVTILFWMKIQFCSEFNVLQWENTTATPKTNCTPFCSVFTHGHNWYPL